MITLPYNFELRDYQAPLWFAMEGGCKRAVAVWHRRSGKDLVAINLAVRHAILHPGSIVWHMLPTLRQARRVVWQGRTKEGRAFLNYIPPALIERIRDDEMLVTLRNGSMIQVVGSDHADALVGANPSGVIFSEWALSNPVTWDYVRPILVENDGWALFISTMRGKNNALYEMLTMAGKNPDWFAEVLSAQDIHRSRLGLPAGIRHAVTHAISLEAIEKEREAGMEESLVLSEFSPAANAPTSGAYYSSQMLAVENEGRIRSVPYQLQLPVVTSSDIGVGDATAIWFSQETAGGEIHLIDYEEFSGLGIDRMGKLIREKPYVYGEHLAPWDLNVREFSSNGQTRIDIARKLGLRFRIVPKLGIDDGVAAVRAMLPRCWFDEERCSKGISSLRGWRKKWDESNRIWLDTPAHSRESHGADAFRYLAVGA